MSFQDADPAHRANLREQWDVPEDTIMLLALGEPYDRVDARLATHVAGVLSVAGKPTGVVLPPGARELCRAKRFRDRHINPWPLIVDDRPASELLDACDGALWLGETIEWVRRDSTYCISGDLLALAAARNRFIVAPQDSYTRFHLGDQAFEALSPEPTVLGLTRLLSQLIEKPELRQTQIESARSHISDTFEVGTWLEHTAPLLGLVPHEELVLS